MYNISEAESVIIYDYHNAGFDKEIKSYFPAQVALLLSLHGANAVYEPGYVNYLPQTLRRQAL